MKKIYFLLILIAGIVNAQIVNIPDPAFKAVLITPSMHVDTNLDGEIQVSEALACTSLTFTNNTITNLTGLEAFTQIYDLRITCNQVTSINLSGNTGLKFLNLTMPLTSINMDLLPLLRNVELINMPAMTSLVISNAAPISSFTLTNLGITSIDLSGMPNVGDVRIMNCSSLMSITADGLALLSRVECFNPANLASVSLTNCPILNDVRINSAQSLSLTNCPMITSLDFLNNDALNSQTLIVNNCTGLTTLNAISSGLTAIDLTTNPNLETLNLYASKVSSLNLSGNPKLKYLTLILCQLITTLDLSANPLMEILAGNSMSSLEMAFLKNGKNETVSLQFCPQLRFICADDSQIASIVSNQPPSVVVNDYCTFTPGGDYNTITGSVRFDNDNNGCSPVDIIPIYAKIGITDGTNTGLTLVKTDASYDFYTGTGSFTVTPQLEQPAYFNVAPTAATVNFPLVNNSIETRDFCVTASGVHPDTEIILVPRGTARPGFDALYLLVFRNKGNFPISGTINLNFDDAHMDFLSAWGNPTQSGDTVSWNYANLMPFEVREFQFVMHVNSTTDTPPVNYDDVLAFSVAINIPTGDDTPDDNVFGLFQVVINAYDPNDKTCLEGTNVLPENIGKYLHYNINFENIGTADAINIVVKDTIDTTRFDINSLQLLYASHPVYTKITGNIVEFIFENINLPPSIMNPIGGHGNVLFKIKTLPNLTVGDEVSNTANIYFDYNAPIDTNEARTAFNNLSKTDFVKDESVTVYPNPAKNKVTVKATGIVKSVQLYDVQGRILQSILDSKSQVILDISNQQRGVYFLTITTDKGSVVEKIIKD